MVVTSKNFTIWENHWSHRWDILIIFGFASQLNLCIKLLDLTCEMAVMLLAFGFEVSEPFSSLHGLPTG